MNSHILIAGLGGFIGTVIRASISESFPIRQPFWITMSINILGSLILGLCIGYLESNPADAKWKAFLTMGICGGFTTFSAFSMENVQLLRNGEIIPAIIYIGSSVLFGITAAWFGYKLTL
ncbi:MAG: fluoride efflux transporter FluC [Ferruginibacter sp.]